MWLSVAAVAALLVCTGVAQASSIGTGQRQLTTDGTSAPAYELPPLADDGALLVARLTIRGGSQPDRGPADPSVAATAGGSVQAAGGPAAGGATRRYAGQVELLSRPGRPVRTGSQGDGWQVVFCERARGTIRYRVCVRKVGAARVRRCWSRRSGRDGRSRVTIALFVNDRGGAGRYSATWTVRARTVATAAFRVRPEPSGR